jgi:hypothetical protein
MTEVVLEKLRQNVGYRERDSSVPGIIHWASRFLFVPQQRFVESVKRTRAEMRADRLVLWRYRACHRDRRAPSWVECTNHMPSEAGVNRAASPTSPNHEPPGR